MCKIFTNYYLTSVCSLSNKYFPDDSFILYIRRPIALKNYGVQFSIVFGVFDYGCVRTNLKNSITHQLKKTPLPHSINLRPIILFTSDAIWFVTAWNSLSSRRSFPPSSPAMFTPPTIAATQRGMRVMACDRKPAAVPHVISARIYAIRHIINPYVFVNPYVS